MMNKKSTVLFLAALFVLLNLNLFAQEVTSKIHPYLQVVLLETPANEMLDVMKNRRIDRDGVPKVEGLRGRHGDQIGHGDAFADEVVDGRLR